MKFTIQDYINQLYLTVEQANLSDQQQATKTEDNVLVPFSDNEWLPLLLLNNTVLFPGVFTHLALKEESIINFVKNAYHKNGKIGIIAPKKHTKINVQKLYPIGTQAQIHKIITLPEGQTIIILQGEKRFKICEITKHKEHLKARVELLKDNPIDLNKTKNKALIQTLREATIQTFSLLSEAPTEIQMMIENIKNPVFLTYYIASNTLEFRYKQKLLEAKTSEKRASLLLGYVLKNLELTKLKQKIQHQAHADMNKQQRELYIRQQIKVLQKELGESAELDDEIDLLQAKAKKQKWPLEAKNHFERTLYKAAKTHPNSPDYTLLINYAHTLIDMPWKVYSQDKKDLKHAEKILDKEHYGMEKPKQRILELLATHSLIQTKEKKGSILCFDGPPGVGKTSLCKSIAKALGRKYLRMSLGGLHDEAELRGHRKTYVGAMMGRILTLIKNAGTANPIFVLDEIDKLDNKRGSPSSVLLEILDPEQNQTFVDNFLEIPFDLSKVLFIATSNNRYEIPRALADRMDFVEVTGYALQEKINIAQKHLIPEQRTLHGLKGSDLIISEAALSKLIENYTSESGVRELTRQIATISRKIAKKLVLQENYQKKIQPENITNFLGIEKYDIEQYQTIPLPGVAIGLAWTEVGGEILFIETVLTKGEGKLTISGQLGEIMEESATAAYTYLKVKAKQLAIDERIFKKYDLHIHVPDGATPKDGPSAGITLYSALASLYTQRKVKEKIAMTGEITLRGNILPVGGIKEKILAAKRAGITQVILSQKNKKDVQEINPEYIKQVNFHYLTHIDELLPLVLEKEKVKNAQEWEIEKNQFKEPVKTLLK